MKFNYALEKKKFEEEWSSQEKKFKAAGMSEEAIQEIWVLDYREFKSRRVFCAHNQFIDYISAESEVVEEGKSPLLEKFMDRFSVIDKESRPEDRYGWINEIENIELYTAIKKLKEEDIELITLLAFEGYSVVDIAILQGVSHQNVSRKMKRLKKYLKKFYFKVAD